MNSSDSEDLNIKHNYEEDELQDDDIDQES